MNIKTDVPFDTALVEADRTKASMIGRVMRHTNKYIISAIFAVALSACTTVAETAEAAAPEAASEEIASDEVFNFETGVTCWDITSLSEEDAGYALVLLYGYHKGKNGEPEMSGLDIQNSIKSAVEYCEANPDALAMSAFAAS